MRILKSEWLKLVSVPTTWLLLGTMLLLEGLAAGLLPGLADIKDLRSRDPVTIMKGTTLQTIFVFTIGALPATHEYRHGTATHTPVITPRRARGTLARLAVGVVVGMAPAVLYSAVNAGLALSIVSSRGVDIDGDLAVNVYIGIGVGMGIFCLFGVALGALLRNQLLTIVVGLIVILAYGIFPLFIGVDVGRFFPGSALISLQGTSNAEKLGYLNQVDGGLVLVGTLVVLSIAGAVVTRYREIN